MSEVCNGKPQCPHKDDEILCNFFCPKKCTCEGYLIDCKQKGVTTLDLKKISPNTRSLDLSQNVNTWKEFRLFVNLTYLFYLNISGCKIVSFSRHPFNTTVNLKILDISYNDFERLEPYMFYQMPAKHLEVLLLNGNKNLKYISGYTFFGISKLNELKITETKVRVLYKNTFSGLEVGVLDLSNNRIEEVESNAFEGLVVSEVNLMSNNIKRFDMQMFAGVSGLQLLKTPAYKFCCVRPSDVTEANCLPYKDEFSSCGDLMRNRVLQALLWVIGLLALVGNIVSLVYRLIYDRRRLSLGYGIFVTNLAVSDLLMGIYLIIIAIADVVLRDR